jgi:hypothetical protein
MGSKSIGPNNITQPNSDTARLAELALTNLLYHFVWVLLLDHDHEAESFEPVE